MLSQEQARLLKIAKKKLYVASVTSEIQGSSFKIIGYIRHAMEMIDCVFAEDQGDAYLEAEANAYTLEDFSDEGKSE